MSVNFTCSITSGTDVVKCRELKKSGGIVVNIFNQVELIITLLLVFIKTQSQDGMIANK